MAQVVLGQPEEKPSSKIQNREKAVGKVQSLCGFPRNEETTTYLIKITEFRTQNSQHSFLLHLFVCLHLSIVRMCVCCVGVFGWVFPHEHLSKCFGQRTTCINRFVLLFSLVGFGDYSQVINLGSRCLYSVSQMDDIGQFLLQFQPSKLQHYCGLREIPARYCMDIWWHRGPSPPPFHQISRSYFTHHHDWVWVNWCKSLLS